jgi:hypothetical protein
VCLTGEPATEFCVFEQLDETGSQTFRVSGFVVEAALSMGDQLPYCGDPRRDDRAMARHVFEKRLRYSPPLHVLLTLVSGHDADMTAFDQVGDGAGDGHASESHHLLQL